MKKYALLKLAAGCLACQLVVPLTALADDASLKTDQEKIGYAIGFNSAQNLKARGFEAADFDVNAFAKGMEAALLDKPSQLPEADMNALFAALQTKLTARHDAKGKEDAKAGEEFLAKNKSEAGVDTLTNGLQYKIITKGTGPIPKLTDTVSVNYRGTLINGDEFDASKPGNPVSFPLTGVIKGWTQILQLMPTGSKWKVFIPSDLAYGDRGAGGKIGPNATLIFDVELVSIK